MTDDDHHDIPNEEDEEEEDENGLEGLFPRPERRVPQRAVTEAMPDDFFETTRTSLVAFASGQLPGNEASPVSMLPREMIFEITQLLRPIRSRTFRVGPHCKGNLWLEHDCTVAVCRLGPSIVTTDESVSVGMLVARLAFWGSPVWCVGVLPADDRVVESGQLWYRSGCGIYNSGAGCALLLAPIAAKDMPCEVVLDMDARMLVIMVAQQHCLFRIPIPESLTPPLCIATTLWARGRTSIVDKNQQHPFVPPDVNSDDQPL